MFATCKKYLSPFLYEKIHIFAAQVRNKIV